MEHCDLTECKMMIHVQMHKNSTHRFVNDPSAGSPTETLLRLLLPLNDQVCPISQE